MAEPKYNDTMCLTATQVLEGGESVAAVCAELDICRTTYYEWKEKHPEFSMAIDRGMQKAQRVWERIGRDGVEGNYEKFSATPWVFTMKNRFRDDYKEDKSDNKGASDSLVERIIDKLVE
jgi:hypothetical protein